MTNPKRRLMSLLFVALIGSPSAQAAESLNDFVANGYHVLKRTEVIGNFRGCERNRTIRFRDNSVFSCNAYKPHVAYSPAAIFLQTKDVPPRFAVLIDGQPYTGVITRLAGKVPLHPIAVTAIDLATASKVITAQPTKAKVPLMPKEPQQPGYPEPHPE